MTIKVIEVELNRPFPTLGKQELDHYTQFQILVRQDGQPIGYAWVEPRSPRFLEEPYLRFEIDRQLFDQLNRAAFGRMLGQGQPVIEPERSNEAWPGLTIAIYTGDQADDLERTLQSFMRLDYPRHKLDLFVLENAPARPVTERVVAAFSNVRHLIEPGPGLIRARNRLIPEANGQLIVYTNDQVVVDALWARALVRHFDNSAVMCVAGLVAPAERETKAQDFFEKHDGFKRDFELRYYTPGPQLAQPFWPVATPGLGLGCNMAYRRRFLEASGGFDEALDIGSTLHSAADDDMVFRAVRGGQIAVYEPQALLWRYHARDYAELRQQVLDLGRGVSAYLTKTFLNEPKMRRRVLAFAVDTYKRRYLKRLRRKGLLPRRLILAEAMAALQGPAAYFAARRQARQSDWIVQRSGAETSLMTNSPSEQRSSVKV